MEIESDAGSSLKIYMNRGGSPNHIGRVCSRSLQKGKSRLGSPNEQRYNVQLCTRSQVTSSATSLNRNRAWPPPASTGSTETHSHLCFFPHRSRPGTADRRKSLQHLFLSASVARKNRVQVLSACIASAIFVHGPERPGWQGDLAIASDFAEY